MKSFLVMFLGFTCLFSSYSFGGPDVNPFSDLHSAFETDSDGLITSPAIPKSSVNNEEAVVSAPQAVQAPSPAVVGESEGEVPGFFDEGQVGQGIEESLAEARDIASQDSVLTETIKNSAKYCEENLVCDGGIVKVDGEPVKGTEGIQFGEKDCVKGETFKNISYKQSACLNYAESKVGESPAAQAYNNIGAGTAETVNVHPEGKVFDGLRDICSDIFKETTVAGTTAELQRFSIEELDSDELFTLADLADSTNTLSIYSCIEMQAGYRHLGAEAKELKNLLKKSKNKDLKLRFCHTFAEEHCVDTYTSCINDKAGSTDACSKLKIGECFETESSLMTSCDAIAAARVFVKKIDQENDYDSTTTVDEGQQGGFHCTKGAGNLALDYHSCQKALKNFDQGYLFGDVAGEIGIGLYGTAANAINQNDVSAQAAVGDAQGFQEASIDAVRKGHIVERNKQIATAGIQSAKAATILGVIRGYLTEEKFSEEWATEDSGNVIGGTVGSATLSRNVAGILNNMIVDSENNPYVVVGQFEDSKYPMNQILFPNQGVLDELKKNAISSFSKAAVATVVAGLQDRQAKLVGGVLDDFQNASFNQPISGISTEGLPTFCSANPTAPSCADSTIGTGIGSGFDVNFGDLGTSIATPIEFDSGSDLTPQQIQELTEATADIPGVGNLTGGASNDKGNSDLNPIAAGNVSSNRRSGGGGGGGGGSGGGGGGGAGPAPSKKGGSGAAAKLGEKTNIKFGSGSSSGFAAGSSRKKSTSKKNPFAGIAASAKRNLASQGSKNLLAKDIKLFQAISNRYTEVKQSGRLK